LDRPRFVHHREYLRIRRNHGRYLCPPNKFFRYRLRLVIGRFRTRSPNTLTRAQDAPLESWGRKASSEGMYRDSSLIRKRLLLEPCSRLMPRALWGSWGAGICFVSEVLRYISSARRTFARGTNGAQRAKCARPLQGYHDHKKPPPPLGSP